MKKKVLIASFIILLALPCRALFAQEVALLTKLDQVIKNQEEILKQLAEIKKEVEVVKIRATR